MLATIKDRKHFIASAILALAAAVFSLMMLFIPTSYGYDANYICAGLLIAFSVLLVIGKITLFNLQKSKTADKIACAAFSALLILMIGINELCGVSFAICNTPYLRIAVLVIFLLLLFVAIYFLLMRVLDWAVYSEIRDPVQNRKMLWIFIGVVSVVSFAFFAACSDGLVYSDGVYVWQQTQRNIYDDWHPIVFVLIVKLCSLVYNSTTSYVILLAALWALTNAFAMRVLHRNHGIRACKIYLVLSLTWGLIAYKYNVYLYKDPLFCMAMLGFAAFLYDFLRGSRKIRTFVALVLYGLLASSVRHSMIIPIAGALVVIIICSFISKIKSKKEVDSARSLAVKYTKRFLILLLVLLIVLNSALHTVAMKVTDASENPPYIMYTVPIHMMGAYAASGYEVDDTTREIMERVMPVEQWAEGYSMNPYWGDNLSRWYAYIGDRVYILEQELSGSEIIGANLRYALSHPISYVSSLMKLNSIVWQISTPESFDEWYDPNFDNQEDETYKQINGYELNPNGFTNIIEPVLIFFKEAPVISNIACRGGVALFVLSLCAYVLFRKKQGVVATVLLPALFLAAVLLLTVPAQDPRYILWAIELAIFVIPITLCINKRD